MKEPYLVECRDHVGTPFEMGKAYMVTREYEEDGYKYVDLEDLDGKMFDGWDADRFVPYTEKVTISKKEYDELLDRDFFLSCLEGAGVDNWCGYEEAWQLYKEDEQE